jgi:hypothetical protein
MEALGWSLIGVGLVLVVSGLILLLPMRREQSAPQQDIEQTIGEIDDQLHEMRRERGDTS